CCLKVERSSRKFSVPRFLVPSCHSLTCLMRRLSMAYRSSYPLSRQKDRSFSKRTVQSGELRDLSHYFANDLGSHL
ncbi:uncharacterized protein METZ01_LOCUS470329, partial [marine metagenome]